MANLILLPDTIVGVLACGGSIRLPLDDFLTVPDNMMKYAAAARAGGGHITFVVGNTMMLPQTMQQVAAAGGPDAVTFDFAGR